MSRVRRRDDRGMALVAVMWMLAALALLAASLIHASRTELQSLQQLRDATAAMALGDAAIQLAALDMRAPAAVPLANRWQRRRYHFDGVGIEVVVQPSAGLINLNKAGAALLRDLFIHAGGMHPQSAARLAAQIIERRQAAALAGDAEAYAALRARKRLSRFDVIEDLLGLEGMDLDIFARIRDLLTVQSPGSDIYPPAAPPEVIGVLAQGDARVAGSYLQGRAADDPTVDMTGLTHTTMAAPADRIYRFDAMLSAPGGVRYRRSAWVDLSQPRHPLPMRLLEVQAVRSLGPAEGLGG